MTMNINRNCPRNERTYPWSLYTSYRLHVPSLYRRWFVALYFLCYLNIRLRRTASRRSTMHRSALLRRDASYRFASRRRQLPGCVILSRYRLMNVFRTWMR